MQARSTTRRARIPSSEMHYSRALKSTPGGSPLHRSQERVKCRSKKVKPFPYNYIYICQTTAAPLTIFASLVSFAP